MSDRDLIIDMIPSLRRYARALTGTADEADDLVQDCLERAMSRWHLWQRDRSLRPWLFAIMHNLYNSRRRRAARRPAEVDIDGTDDVPGIQPTQLAGLEIAELAAALQELNDEQREAVLLVGLEGCSYAEVAAITDVPIGTVMSRLSRGRERLRVLLAGGGGPALRRVK
jgi:RNA polymerase sigma-70 factor (ECF subfamily)